MDTDEFREFGKAAVDYLADYTDTLRERPVIPNVEPGYLGRLIPDEAPEKPESWQEVLGDVERVIMPGMTHWNSPQFHGYFPSAVSYPSIVAEMLSAGIGCLGFSWMTSPVCTELEVTMMNWLGKMLGLPEQFLNCTKGPGGGVIQSSASVATFVGLLAAKERTTRRMMKLHPDWSEADIKAKLIAYTSDQANSSVEKAGLLGSMPMRHLPSDEHCRLRGSTLLEAIEKDEREGLIPCYVVATLGTTGTCAHDCLEELGPICNDKNVWLHVDAAYAGAAFVCPEFRHLMSGVEFADSFDFNPHKWLLVNFDCSAMWVKDSRYLVEAFNVDRIYLAHEKEGQQPDYRHWQIPLGRRFRALKLWFVMRMYGVQGLQNYIRHTVNLAKQFEGYIRNDDRFEIVTEVTMALVCFRMKGDNSNTRELLDKLLARRKIYVIAATYREKLFIRFVVCSSLCEARDMEFAWKEVSERATEILNPVPQQDVAVMSAIESSKEPATNIATMIKDLKIEHGLKEKAPKIS
ncbi:aromatic-L-amino-acid decarboxylase-like [Neodiprion virginianus]|uniref:aromatic-L-amino-acid decarboxylase-like n=1 Tax=Neodiprion virginianus TaxID=2961670 RepID=UPI001EE772A2|nr:aromatic-L-amino-acid decarboxylase-like [Neodiprion virginianus]